MLAEAAFASAKELVLVENGSALCTVVVPENADSFTQMAGGWLVQYIERTTGVKLRLVSEQEMLGGTLISVGHTRLAARAGITAQGLKYDGCRIAVVDNVLYLIGHDSDIRNGAVPSPEEGPWLYHYENLGMKSALEAGAKGTCRAVTAFLEQFCGVRWLTPAKEGIHVPRIKRLSVPANLDWRMTPAFAFGIGSFFYGSPLSRPAAYANNIRSAIRMRHYGGHSYHYWLPAGLFEKNPEYFILYNGRRTNLGNHLCASNPEVRQILLKGIKEEFDRGYDWVELGQSDGHIPCQCEECQKMDKDPGRRILLLHQWICNEVAKTHPGKTVILLAYGPTKNPWSDIQFGDNVVIEITGGSYDSVNAWNGYGRGLVIYTYWFDESLGIGFGPRMSPAEASEIVRYYYNQSVVGIFGSGGSAWGLMGPTYYVLGKMMGDPSLDYTCLVKEYCSGLFGKAAEDMEQFFYLLYSRSYWNLNTRHGMNMTINESMLHLYPPQFIHALDERLRKAEESAVTEQEQNWVRMTRDEFDYIRHMSNMLYLYNAYLINNAPAIFDELKLSVERFNTYRRRIVSYEGDRVTDYFPGHGYLAKFLSTGVNSGSYYTGWRELRAETDYEHLDKSGVGYPEGSSLNVPITLNFDAIESEHVFLLKRTDKPIKLDGLLDSAEWKGSTPTVMKTQVHTYVHGMYDENNLYIAFLCDEPEIEKLNVHDLYRDGEVSLMDCVEFMVSPESSVYATRYYHFLVAPSKDALMDLRTGFKSERDQDETWNAEGFKYAYNIDKKNKRWSIEMIIPFGDIKAPVPGRGDVWMGNLARERRVGALELQLWSQGGSGGFTDSKAFGRFVFN